MDELTKIAMIGTGKLTGPLPPTEHPVDALFARREDGDREHSLLLRIGAQAVYAVAGRKGPGGIELPEASPPETKALASRAMARLLETAAATAESRLLLEFFGRMSARRVVLPHHLLPLILDSRDDAIRRGVISVLSERGVWLARQNPAWSYFHAPSEIVSDGADVELRRVWDEGTIDDRCRVLKTVRGRDPHQGREWIAEALAREKPAHRTKLLCALETGLGADDEPFLESCLNDRSPAVGRAAAGLLCGLAGSALAGRMRARAGAMLALDKAKLVCTPPPALDRDWERDGIPEQPPAGQGQRAFGVESVLALIPPSHWQAVFGLTPPTLVGAITDDPFAAAVCSGWTKAALAYARHDAVSAEWLVPLWRHWAASVRSATASDRRTIIERLLALLALMPSDRAEEMITSHLEPSLGWDEVDVLTLVPALPRPWSAEFCATLLETARHKLERTADQASHRWASVLEECACAVPPAAFLRVLAPWKLAPPEPAQTWFATATKTEIDKLCTVIELRRQFLIELDALSSS
jgi:Family of unknown function (DUF5691)